MASIPRSNAVPEAWKEEGLAVEGQEMECKRLSAEPQRLRRPEGPDECDGPGRPTEPCCGGEPDPERPRDAQHEYRHCVEAGKKLSESVLWEQMRRFYATQGVEAWSKGIVPFFITCNAFIASAYAKTILGYIQDVVSSGDFVQEEPFHIVELGVGSGKFSFLLLKALMERVHLYYGDEAPFRITYVMTDFCDAPFGFWKAHRALRKYINQGTLDFATLDACNDASIVLRMSGKSIEEGSLQNPLIVVANYLFDSLPADAYRMHRGRLEEGLVSIWSKQDEPDPTEPAILSRFNPVFQWEEIVPEKMAQDDAILASILLWYQEHFESQSASITIPSASLACLNNLRRLSKTGAMLVLSGDKGTSNTLALQQAGGTDPHIAVHGSFSLMVNYHSIGLWADACGGFALHCPIEDASLKVSAFVVNPSSWNVNENGKGKETETGTGTGTGTEPFKRTATGHWNCYGDPLPSRVNKYPNLKMAFHDTMKGCGPDHFFHLQQYDWSQSLTIPKDAPNGVLDPANTSNEQSKGVADDSRIRAVVALLQLSDWDADLAYKFREIILSDLGKCSSRLIEDIKRGLERAWENYFLLELDKDLSFELGRFYYGLHEFEKALVHYSKSSEMVGRHHVTEHNIGLCHLSLGSPELALSYFDASLELNPAYTKAHEQRNLVRVKLGLPRIKCPTTPLAVNSDKLLSTSSPLNSPHRRVSFDPEVLHRSRRN